MDVDSFKCVIVCGMCGEWFGDVESITKHMVTHTYMKIVDKSEWVTTATTMTKAQHNHSRIERHDATKRNDKQQNLNRNEADRTVIANMINNSQQNTDISGWSAIDTNINMLQEKPTSVTPMTTSHGKSRRGCPISDTVVTNSQQDTCRYEWPATGANMNTSRQDNRKGRWPATTIIATEAKKTNRYEKSTNATTVQNKGQQDICKDGWPATVAVSVDDTMQGTYSRARPVSYNRINSRVQLDVGASGLVPHGGTTSDCFCDVPYRMQDLLNRNTTSTKASVFTREPSEDECINYGDESVGDVSGATDMLNITPRVVTSEQSISDEEMSSSDLESSDDELTKKCVEEIFGKDSESESYLHTRIDNDEMFSNELMLPREITNDGSSLNEGVVINYVKKSSSDETASGDTSNRTGDKGYLNTQHSSFRCRNESESESSKTNVLKQNKNDHVVVVKEYTGCLNPASAGKTQHILENVQSVQNNAKGSLVRLQMNSTRTVRYTGNIPDSCQEVHTSEDMKTTLPAAQIDISVNYEDKNKNEFLVDSNLHPNISNTPEDVQMFSDTTDQTDMCQQQVPDGSKDGNTCALCLQRFPLHRQLQRHMLDHTYTCYICKGRYLKLEHLRIHMDDHWRQMRGGTGKDSNSNLLTNPREAFYICTVCEKRCPTLNELKLHMLFHNRVDKFGKEVNNFDLFCGECKEFKRKKYFCRVCLKSFMYRHSAKLHMNIHLGKRVSCQICKDTFSTRSSYIRHEKRKHQITGFGNPDTSVGSGYRNSVKQDARLHSLKLGHIADDLNRSMRNLGQGRPYCEVCQKWFSTVQYTWKHIEMHMTVKDRRIPVMESRCYHCNKTFAQEKTLERHMKLHTEQSFPTCGTCKKVFSSVECLTDHMSEHREKTRKKFICSSCGRCFDLSVSLTNHKKRCKFSHLGSPKRIKPLKCEKCWKFFPDARRLDRHGLIHSYQRKHVCPVCGRSYFRLQALKYHMMLKNHMLSEGKVHRGYNDDSNQPTCAAKVEPGSPITQVGDIKHALLK